MFGNCAIGSVGMEMSPSSRITSENTDAKMGRRRKKSITKPWTKLSSAGFPSTGSGRPGEPAFQRDDLTDHATGNIFHRDDSMLPQRGARRGFEHAQRLERREGRRRRGPARAVDHLERKAEAGVEQRVTVEAFRTRLGDDPAARRAHQVGVETAGPGDVPRLVRHRGRYPRQRRRVLVVEPAQRRQPRERDRGLAQRRRVDRDAAAVDGCGIPVYATTLRKAAVSFARLATLRGLDDEDATALARVASAMTNEPGYVAGTGRFDTDLMRATGGRIVSKAGAEGFHCDALLDAGLGLALKVVDGSRRAAPPATLATLEALRVLEPTARAALRQHAVIPVKNVAGRVVGEVVALEGWLSGSP